MWSHSNDSLQVDISQIVAVNSATAHPHEDADGTIHNLGMVFKGKPAYAIIKMTPPAPGNIKKYVSRYIVSGRPENRESSWC